MKLRPRRAGRRHPASPRRSLRQAERLRRLHPALPFVGDDVHLLFRGDARVVSTKDAIVEHGRALDRDYES